MKLRSASPLPVANRALEIMVGSDGEATREFYKILEDAGPLGRVAVNLFRAQKTSGRAKMYRGRRFKRAAYDTKSWSLANLCEILEKHGAEVGFRYGWKQDTTVVFGEDPSWVLYVDLPTGQVSFHSPTRGKGPEYAGEWDGVPGVSGGRIVGFVQSVYERKVPDRQPIAPDPRQASLW